MLQKKIALSLIAPFLISLATNAQTNFGTQRNTIVYKSTADWCGPCGTWGWTIFEGLINARKTNPSTFKAVPFAVHVSSNQTFLNSATGSGVEDNCETMITGIPTFVVDNEECTNTSLSGVTASINNKVAAAPDAKVAFGAIYKGTDSLIVPTTVKFDIAASGEYRVVAYIIEDSVLATQNGQSGIVGHHNLLRGAVGNVDWNGVQLTGTSFTVNQQIKNTFRMKLPSTWKKNKLQVIAIIYKKKTNGKYTVVNVNDQVSPMSFTDMPKTVVSGIYPNPIKSLFSINLTKPTATCQVELYDIAGRLIEKIYHGSSHTGRIDLQKPSHATAGLYLLKINTDEGSQTLKVQID